MEHELTADKQHGKRYREWRELEAGTYALARGRDLLRHMLSGWPRRSRSVLALGAGSCEFVETLWEAGFDVTAQDNDPDFLEEARKLLGGRADFVLSAPDHLPFDDNAFDYVVAALALEFWERPEAVLAEAKRLALGGVILLFANAWSLFGLECRLRATAPLCATALPLLRSPRQVRALAGRAFGKKKQAWASCLPLPTFNWSEQAPLRRVNTGYCPLPLGAFAGLRVDFGPAVAGTPLILRSTEPVAPAKP